MSGVLKAYVAKQDYHLAVAIESVDGPGLSCVLVNGDTKTMTPLQAGMAYMIGGSAPQSTLGTWAAVTDGEFKIDIDGSTVTVSALDFSAATNATTDIAAIIDTALGSDGDCAYEDGTFNFYSPTVGASSAIAFCVTAGGSGTDIHGSGFLDCDAADAVLTQGSTLTPVAGDICRVQTGRTGYGQESSVNVFYTAAAHAAAFEEYVSTH